MKNGKRTTAIYKKFGSLEDIKIRSRNEDPSRRLKNYVSELNDKVQPKTLSALIKNIKMFKQDEEYFSPVYTRTNLTGDLHQKFGFNTDLEIISKKNKKRTHFLPYKKSQRQDIVEKGQ